MTSEELAALVSDLINACSERIMGVGNEQYSRGDIQTFETMQINDLFQYAYEELQDMIVYSAMLHIRLKRTEETLNTLSSSSSQSVRGNDVGLDRTGFDC